MDEEKELEELLKNRYLNPSYDPQTGNKFIGTVDDRVVCLFLAGKLTYDQINILYTNDVISKECMDIIIRADQLLKMSSEQGKEMPEELLHISKVLSSSEIKRAFSIPVDALNDHTVFDNLMSLVIVGTISDKDFYALKKLGLIPEGLINTKHKELYEAEGIIAGDDEYTFPEISKIMQDADYNKPSNGPSTTNGFNEFGDPPGELDFSMPELIDITKKEEKSIDMSTYENSYLATKGKLSRALARLKSFMAKLFHKENKNQGR